MRSRASLPCRLLSSGNDTVPHLFNNGPSPRHVYISTTRPSRARLTILSEGSHMRSRSSLPGVLYLATN